MEHPLKNEDILLRPFAPEDISAAVELTRTEGWPHREEDWAFHLQHGAGWAAENELGHVVGTLLCWCYGEATGTMGLIVVDRNYRGRGIGAQLMECGIEEYGSRRLGLVSTQAGLKLYQQFGFVGRGEILQRQAVIGTVELVEPATGLELRKLTLEDLEDLAALDRAATGDDRLPLMQSLLPLAEGYGLFREASLVGFAMVRPSGRGQTIGPVVAESEENAIALISKLLSTREGFVRIDLPAEMERLNQWLGSVGLEIVDQATLMYRGVKERELQKQFQRYGLVSQALG